MSRMTYVRPVVFKDGRETPIKEMTKLCRKDHAREFGVELSRRAELSEFIGRHGKRGFAGWFHRLWYCRELMQRVRLANFRVPPRLARKAVHEAAFLWLCGNDLANRFSALFDKTEEQRAATVRQI